MGFGVLFALLMIVSGWWLYSRWSALRDAQSQRREAEMMMVFEARSKRQATTASSASVRAVDAADTGDFKDTRPGDRA